jgi:hypothetical protein
MYIQMHTDMFDRNKISIFLLIMFSSFLLFTQDEAIAQPDRADHERWGVLGRGKLVTKMSNTNVIASARANYLELAQFPAFEYPYNPNPEGRKIYYGSDVSFHVGGFSMDKGPAIVISDPNNPIEYTRPTVESGDQGHYRFYKGFHFDGFPEYITSNARGPVPLSDDPYSWPEAGWPDFLPTSDPFLDSRYPNYPTAFSEGYLDPIPLPRDSITGFPGIGPNRFSEPGLHYPGRVVADQESFTVSYSRNRADDLHEGKLMIYTTLRGLSWEGELAEDMLFFQFTVTNIGTEPIDTTYIGIYANLEFPWATWSDFNTYTRSNAFALDTYDVDPETGREYQIAYGFKGDGGVPGANTGNIPLRSARLVDETRLDQVAMAGIVFLETPEVDMDQTYFQFNRRHVRDRGMTTFTAFNHALSREEPGIGNTLRRFYWYQLANAAEDGRGPKITNPEGDGIDRWNWEVPFPVGKEEKFNNGQRGAMSVNTGPVTIMPGETDTLTIAVIMGMTRSELFANARVARQIYESGWVVPKAPLTPDVIAEPGDGEIVLRWGNISENDELNERAGRQPFEGYKIYRSTDGGRTWGDRVITNSEGDVVDYVPFAQYDLDNGITGASPVQPTFNRGSDTGFDDILTDDVFTRELMIDDLNEIHVDTVQYKFIDRNVTNGMNYSYAVVAYSAGDEDPDGIQPLQSSRTSGANVVRTSPRSPVSQTSDELKNIRVVPNPYRVYNPLETSTREGLIKFTNLPETCTIRIFNVAGEHIRTLQHNASNASVESEANWNLRSYENRDVAPGLYFYHIESDLGSVKGRLVIIK